eukprot:8908696-Ditylum_brightwellii.AAC.1
MPGFELSQTRLRPTQESNPIQQPQSSVRLSAKLHLIPVSGANGLDGKAEKTTICRPCGH